MRVAGRIVRLYGSETWLAANRTRLVVGFSALCLAAALLLPALPQPPAYHDFADRRAILGIANPAREGA